MLLSSVSDASQANQTRYTFLKRTTFSIDSGETSYLPISATFNQDDKYPWIFTMKYVQTATKFGAMTETRVGRGTQNETYFVRMLDKYSTWEYGQNILHRHACLRNCRI